MTRLLTFTVFVVCLPAISHAKPPVVTSVCTIAAHPSKFHNKAVRVRAAALSGMEAAILVDRKDGRWNEKCGRINLDFESIGNDETTSRFLKLFGTQISVPPCDREKELKEGTAHILDSNAPAPKPCFDSFCVHCPRYDIVATFTGKLRYSGSEPGRVPFGHLAMFTLQLDVRRVSNLDITDTQAVTKP
jgi:hypothetical protein